MSVELLLVVESKGSDMKLARVRAWQAHAEECHCRNRCDVHGTTPLREHEHWMMIYYIHSRYSFSAACNHVRFNATKASMTVLSKT